MTTLGMRLRKAREAKGLTQEALADYSQVSQTTIDKIERGVTKHSRLLYKIARALDMSLGDLDPDTYGEPTLANKLISSSEIEDVSNLPISKMVPIFALDYFGSEDRNLSQRDPLAGFIGRHPFDFIDRPPIVSGSFDAYAIYVSSNLMEPEFLIGDIVFIDPKLPVIKSSSAIFSEKSSPELRILAHIIDFNHKHWLVRQWQDEAIIQLKRSEHETVHRVVAKYYRR